MTKVTTQRGFWSELANKKRIMNTQLPISNVMTKHLITLNPEKALTEVERIFSETKIHHIPIVEFKTLVGIVSKSDFLFFQRGKSNTDVHDEFVEKIRYKNYKVKDIMTTGIASLNSADKISTAIKIFQENIFHCVPIVDDEELVGIVTPIDIINNL